MKHRISRIQDKNRIINNIIQAITERQEFLVVGHRYPDEDCIASTVAFALLLTKFHKNASIYVSYRLHEHFQFLINICQYNSIRIVTGESDLKNNYDTVVICDTAHPGLMDTCPTIKRIISEKKAMNIEIDHHIGGDSRYSGDKGLCLVDEASSTCELIGFIVYKLSFRTELLKKFNVAGLITRNLVLAILTGIIGDSNMGSFLKSKRERKIYNIISDYLGNFLSKETTNQTYIASIPQLSEEIHRLSKEENNCFQDIIQKKTYSSSMGIIVLDRPAVDQLEKHYNVDILTAITRKATDVLAEESGKLGVFAYFDYFNKSNQVRFKIRRSSSFKSFDLRRLFKTLSITDGGGHEGAISFRYPNSDIDDINTFAQNIIEEIEKEL